MLTRHWYGLLLAAAVPVLAQAQVQAQTGPRIPVEDFTPLLLQAIDAPSGTAQGTLIGPAAQAISQHFAASTPIRVDVSTQLVYAQHGCRRLQVAVWQDDVRLQPGAAPARQSITFGINYCLDGKPPADLTKGAPR
ncbi:hypothetical protein [Pseudoduganella violacea]|uniref:Uncharacterized protein n=1 Tax=Pseudoduganella violacea TaxID=1715466 RepID=A0A7W5FWT1_9BURK|nr:hypothetical protein [Pseudoduganella violacea]MBB3122166.1 hypothetical protein [Pseudoduganella violacea]